MDSVDSMNSLASEVPVDDLAVIGSTWNHTIGKGKKKASKPSGKIHPEVSFFKEYSEKRYELYRHIFSLPTLSSFFLEKLKSFMMEDRSKESISIMKTGVFDNISKDSFTWDEVSLIVDKIQFQEGIRDWVRYVYSIAACKAEFKLGEEDWIHNIVEELKETSAFESWAREVINRCFEIDSMKNRFAVENIGLMWSLSQSFVKKKVNIPVEDLRQEAFFGLLKSVDRFDYTLGWRFSTYALFWLKHYMQRHVEDNNTVIRIPVHLQGKRAQIFAWRNKVYSQKARWPTALETAQAFDLEEHHILALFSINKMKNLDEKTSPHGDGGELTIHEIIADENVVSGYDRYADGQISDKLKRVFSVLTPIERRIIEKRFGFFDPDTEYTLKEVGEELRLSRERIRQIQEEALVKMKNCLSREDFI